MKDLEICFGLADQVMDIVGYLPRQKVRSQFCGDGFCFDSFGYTGSLGLEKIWI